jgi:hypothetical protein
MNKSECQVYSDGIKQWWFNNTLHREDGPAVEGMNGCVGFYLNGKHLNPIKTIHDSEFQVKYPKLVESMIIYLVHEV